MGLYERFRFFDVKMGLLEGEEGDEVWRAWAGFAVLGTILREIERSVPEDFRDPDEVRRRLVQAGQTARDGVSESFGSPPPPNVVVGMEEERARFVAYVGALTIEEALAVEPEPYRRVLTARERRRAIERVRKRWPSGEDHWHPLDALTRVDDVLHVETAWLGHEVVPDLFRRALASDGYTRIWMLHESSPGWDGDHRPDLGTVDYEIAADFCWPVTFGLEVVWAPRQGD